MIIVHQTIELHFQSKDGMSKQYNKAEKKQRRLRYIKRKKVAAKAKKPAAQSATAATA